jgi:hypothetical protein
MDGAGNFLPVLGLRDLQPAWETDDQEVLELEIPSSGLVEDTLNREISRKRQCVAPESDDLAPAPVAWFAGEESAREGLREAVRTYDFPWSVRRVIRSS